MCQNSIFITFYNVKSDVKLVQSYPMKSFLEHGANYDARFCEWMALNFGIFSSESCDLADFFFPADQSGFQHCLQKKDVLEKYETKVQCKLSYSKDRQSLVNCVLF